MGSALFLKGKTRYNRVIKLSKGEIKVANEEITAAKIEENQEAVVVEKEKKQRVVMVSETNLLIDDCAYRLVTNYREGFDAELLGERYSDVLNRYEYIVGDIGFEQLRLRGFFSDDHVNMPAEQRISQLPDYLYEFCNFGCAYFVLERIGEHPVKESKHRSKRSQSRGGRQHTKKPAHITEKRQVKDREPREKKLSNRQRPVIKQRKDSDSSKREGKGTQHMAPKQPVNSPVSEAPKKERGFTIRKKNN